MSCHTAINMVAHPLSDKFSTIGARLGQKSEVSLGAMVWTVIPVLAPVAATLGGFIGGVVGKVAGSAVGQAIKQESQKIVDFAKPVLKTAWEGIKSIGSTIASGVKSIFNSIFG